MIDSAIGGKTGINVAAGKNLVGAFWQPALVLADPELLTTLPVRERRAAYGELLKYALLDGEELYQLVAALAPAFAGTAPCDPAGPLAEAIRRSVAIKSWIVSRDEREQLGERALLNLGHTVGHAIETAAGYGTLLHGEAVGLGLLASCRVSARLGLCAAELEVRVRDSLASAHMEVDLQRWLRPDVLAHIGVDKKRSGGEIDFVTLRDVGSPEITRVALDRLTSLLLQ
jgi:3-dehydroquinate synthetase